MAKIKMPTDYSTTNKRLAEQLLQIKREAGAKRRVDDVPVTLYAGEVDRIVKALRGGRR